MEIQQPWRVRLSFKNATILLTVLNVIGALFLFQGFISSASSRNSRVSSNQFRSVIWCVDVYFELLVSFKENSDIKTLRHLLSSCMVFAVLISPNFLPFQLKYVKESEEIRLAMQPWELMKRVKEIEQEAYAEPETVKQKDIKQTAAVDLSKRLKDFRSLNDAASLKALEEWRKRKMERARLRKLEKNGTVNSSQA